MKNLNITDLEIVTAFSEAFDLMDEKINNHHYEVAYLAYEIAKKYDVQISEIKDLVIAALMHDIGCFKSTERIELLKFESEKPHIHSMNGYYLLKSYPPFFKLANYVKDHHKNWNEFSTQDEVALLSNIIFIADRIVILFNKNKQYQGQLDVIETILRNEAGKKFSEKLVNIFCELKSENLIWLNLQYGNKGDILNENLKYDSKKLSFEEIIELGRVFAQIIDFRNRFTALHSTGVASIAQELSKLLGVDEYEQKKLLLAGYFHDIGKLSTPNEILNKKSNLSEKEYNIIKLHPYHTYRIISKIKDFKEIAVIASQHHEKIDGRGYPFGLKNEELSFESRILAVSDVFTALTEDRPYRSTMEKTSVISILTGMSKNQHLDSLIVNVVKNNFDRLQNINLINQKKIRIELNEMDNFLV